MLRWIQPVLCVSLLAGYPVQGHAGRSFIRPMSPTTIANPAISFSASYAFPTSYWAYPNSVQALNSPMEGDNLLILGKIAAFQAPFEDLNPADPELEFTYRMRNLTVAVTGIWDDFTHHESGIYVEYTGGVLEIYRDTSPDADYVDPGTFADGEMILSASMTWLDLILYSSQTPPQDGGLVFTGGTLFNRVSEAGVGFTANNEGNFAMNPDVIPDNLEELGSNAMSQTVININPGVPVRSTTWGRIKALLAAQ
jgi:hypothetical protein